ncbi:MAG: NAD(P)H-binding protein [Solirubrobacteraceae bacterium]
MARVLIIGGGCRGRALAAALVADGHAVRMTTRAAEQRAAIAGAGAEPFVGDPDRIGSLMEALAGVTVVCWMLGTATGDPDRVAALHGTRLRFFLEKTVDTPVRGVVYEASGTVPAAALAGGRAEAEAAAATWQIPLAVLTAPPGDQAAWLPAARGAVAGLLRPEPPVGPSGSVSSRAAP